MHKKIEMAPIGIVERDSPDERVKDRELISKVVLRNELTDALDGIEEFSHLFVIFWLDKVQQKEAKALKIHPRSVSRLPLVGVFATRTPNRPNPIGLTLVELIKREANTLFVKGLDAFDKTPVLDIKGYDNWDMVAEARIPGWLSLINRQ